MFMPSLCGADHSALSSGFFFELDLGLGGTCLDLQEDFFPSPALFSSSFGLCLAARGLFRERLSP